MSVMYFNEKCLLSALIAVGNFLSNRQGYFLSSITNHPDLVLYYCHTLPTMQSRGFKQKFSSTNLTGKGRYRSNLKLDACYSFIHC
jgi:hypothetical protein